MSTIENHQLKGITIKNIVVTIASTASIVASVMTTYFGLKTDMLGIKSAQEAETRINNVRIKILESEVALLQKEVNDINFRGKLPAVLSLTTANTAAPALLSAVDKQGSP